MDTRSQRRPRRAVSVAQPAGTSEGQTSTENQSAKKEAMDKSGGTAKKRRTPPGVSDDESRQEKKVKIENEPSRRQRTLTRAARGRSHANADDDVGSGTASKVTAEVASDHVAPSSDEDKAGAKSASNDQPKSTSTASRARRAAAAKAKQEKELNSILETETRPTRRRCNGNQSNEVKPSVAAKPVGPQMRGNEVEFGQHWRSSRGLSFDTATKVLMMTLKSAKHIDLAEENMQICADCRGGGDLLCCDCCPLAFHADCLEPLERPASLYVPIPKHGLKTRPTHASMHDREPNDDNENHDGHGDETNTGADALTKSINDVDSVEERLRLRDSEWFCPYCLSHPILKLWKRGVPRLLSLFEGFNCTEQEDYKETRPRKVVASADSALKKDSLVVDADMTEDEDADEDHTREVTSKNANVVEWMSQVERFVSQPHSVDALFPPSILLALSGIRRAIQRHGALYSAVSKTELDKLSEKESLKNIEPPPSEVLPLPDTDEAAEPSVVVKNDVVIKAPIMGRRSSSSQVKSEDEQGSATIKSEAPPRRSTRRAQALAERRAIAAARNAAKPIVREKEHPPEYDEGPVVQAKINVGASFQVPGVNRHFLEAREFGLDYLIFDKRSVCAYLPMDHMGRVPTARLHLGSGCRLVYSATELRKRQERIAKLKKTNESTLAGLPQVPLTDEELSEFTRQVIAVWPVWIQWPPTQEFALKLLHHCRYDAKAAIRLLCSDALQFRAVCDPPVKPYMNKWRPRDRRGHLPSIPFPPPSNAIALMGVGRAHSAGNKTDFDM